MPDTDKDKTKTETTTPAPKDTDQTTKTTAPDQSATGQSLECQSKETEPDPAVTAAREEITQFFGQTYTQQNYVTANGYGAFDLSYAPTTSQCAVTVNLEFDFQDAPASVLMKYLPIIGSNDLLKMAECKWTEDKKKQFKSDMVKEVDRVWSGKHTAKCTYTNPDLKDQKSPTWADAKADIKCVVNPVDSGGHFKVKVLALPKEDRLRPFVSGGSHATGGASTGGEVKGNKFKTTGATLNSTDNQVNTIGSSFGGQKHTVKAGDTLKSIALKWLGSESKDMDIYNINKGVIGNDPTVALQAGWVLDLPAPDTNQVTTAHEFGHMLGQDDQYIDSSAGRNAGGTNDSGDRVSELPADEQRIMDGGEVVLKEHYGSILTALNAATKPFTFAL